MSYQIALKKKTYINKNYNLIVFELGSYCLILLYVGTDNFRFK